MPPKPYKTNSDIILSRLMELHPKLIDLSLDRTFDLLKRMGNPQNKLPPVVHVAGTNGKGSTIAFLRAICEAAGLSVHVYTSPHLVKFHERIRLAGELISENYLMELLEYCEDINQGEAITYFEITTCAAFKAFCDNQADIILLETGLGGRLDSTNVIDDPAISIITPISMDHTQFLGDSIESIAAEKAEIQKYMRPSIIGKQDQNAAKILQQIANRKTAQQMRYGIEWSIEKTTTNNDNDNDNDNDSCYMRYSDNDHMVDLPKPSLLGTHQIENAGMAIAAALELRSQGFNIPNNALKYGIANAQWPARMQHLNNGPIVEKFGKDWNIWLDGGHNAAAGIAISDMIKTWVDYPLYIVFGMLNTKAAGDFLTPIAPYIKSAVAIQIPNEENSLTANQAAKFAKDNNISCETANSIDQAADILLRNHEKYIQETGNKMIKPRLLICGSLYLAGIILAS